MVSEPSGTPALGLRFVSRRTLLGAAGLAAAGFAVSACSSSGGSSASSPAAPTASTTSGTTVLGSTMSIPVGGGQIYTNAQVVVTQPTSGQYLGFSAVCPHQGCLVAAIQQGQIICPCHMSTFSVSTGDVTSGPAPTGLSRVKVAVQGTDVVLES